MRVPWLAYAGSIAQLFPLVAATIRRGWLSAARKWIAGWCAFLLASDLLVLLLALQGRNNHWVTYVATPIEVGLVLWAVSRWQVSRFTAQAIRLMIPILWMAWVAMVALVESTQTFSLLAQPIEGLFVVGAVFWTLVIRAVREPSPLREQDWLWMGIGAAIYFGGAVALPPASYLLLAESPNLVIRAYEVRGALNVVAFILIARGFLCPPGLVARGSPFP